MFRIVGALLAVSFLAAIPARAADPTVVIGGDSGEAHVPWAKVIDAAEKVCRIARAHDLSGDFGTQDECVENSTRLLVVRHVEPAEHRVAANAAR